MRAAGLQIRRRSEDLNLPNGERSVVSKIDVIKKNGKKICKGLTIAETGSPENRSSPQMDVRRDALVDGDSASPRPLNHVGRSAALSVPNRDKSVGVVGHLLVSSWPGRFAELAPVGGELFERNAVGGGPCLARQIDGAGRSAYDFDDLVSPSGIVNSRGDDSGQSREPAPRSGDDDFHGEILPKKTNEAGISSG